MIETRQEHHSYSVSPDLGVRVEIPCDLDERLSSSSSWEEASAGRANLFRGNVSYWAPRMRLTYTGMSQYYDLEFPGPHYYTPWSTNMCLLT